MPAPSPARLTPLPRLGEWILIALLDLGARSPGVEQTSQDVLIRIGELFDDLITSADRQPDPDRPGSLMWQSRVRLARRYLGEDDLVTSSRTRWRLTDVGHRAAVEFVASVLRSSRRFGSAPARRGPDDAGTGVRHCIRRIPVPR